ncbi:MAG: enoyl-CoA hydratase-related protein [Calditrichia bacterium]
METQNISMQVKEKVATLIINRPKKLNALNAETITQLFHLLKQLKSDNEVAVIVISGSGEKAFVAGADIGEITRHDDISGRIFALRGQKVFRYIEKMQKPVIAAVNGYALGGGMELAMACHLRIASEKAVFGQPEINLGIIPGYGGTQRLPRLVGNTRALYLLLTGNSINAETALKIGLVNEVVPHDKVMERALALAAILTGKAPLAVQNILSAVTEGSDMNLEAGLNLEAELFGNLCASEDMKEGTTAFLEKRDPVFKGK